MKFFKSSLFLLISVWGVLLTFAAATESPTSISGMTMVQIGDPGNAPYLLGGKGMGGVGYEYDLGKYEITVQDWSNFLTAVAFQSDPDGLWNERMAPWITRTGSIEEGFTYTVVPEKGNLPITNVSLWNACRFCNWFENGAPSGLQNPDLLREVLETGAYFFVPNHDPFPNPEAIFYIPSQGEWVKAGYYKGHGLQSGFWNYPTCSDTLPGNRESNNLKNKANWDVDFGWWSSPVLGLTDVNAFPETMSAYGCCDMAGNVSEWTMTPGNPGQYLVLGGSYLSKNSAWGNQNDLVITAPSFSCDPTLESNLIGFRVAERLASRSSVGSTEAPLLNQGSNSPKNPNFFERVFIYILLGLCLECLAIGACFIVIISPWILIVFLAELLLVFPFVLQDGVIDTVWPCISFYLNYLLSSWFLKGGVPGLYSALN